MAMRYCLKCKARKPVQDFAGPAMICLACAKPKKKARGRTLDGIERKRRYMRASQRAKTRLARQRRKEYEALLREELEAG